MTIQQAKDQVAHEYCFQDWSQVQRIVCSDEMGDLLDAVAKLYASEKVKEALQLAAERAYAYIGADDEPKVSKGSILSLETELIEKINKEI